MSRMPAPLAVAEGERWAMSDLQKHVEHETLYFLTCSDCETRSGEEVNPTLAATFADLYGWRSIGERSVCPSCAKNYPDVLCSETIPASGPAQCKAGHLR